MKKPLSFIFILVLVTSPGLVNSQANYRTPDPVTIEHNRITVGVLPQVELISIVQIISKYPEVFSFLMTKDTTDYRTEVMNHFSRYRNNPAVLMFDRLSMQPGMLNFSAPSNIMLYTDESLSLRAGFEPEEFVINRAGGKDSLNIFLGLLRDFAIESSFNSFFESHRDFYLAITENTVRSMGTTDYITELEKFYGKTQKSYNIVLVPLYGHVGFGNSLLFSDQKREIFNTIGPRLVKDGISSFGDEEYLKYMIRHEFSHPFVNPLTEKYWDQVKDYSHNYESVPESARKNMCGDWQECINEFVIRAVTTHLASVESSDAGARAYAKEKARGVSLLDELLDKIKLYESGRGKYPDFDSFYPHILEVFRY